MLQKQHVRILLLVRHCSVIERKDRICRKWHEVIYLSNEIHVYVPTIISHNVCMYIFGNIRSICFYQKEAQTYFINVSQIRPDIANILTRIILFIKIFYAFQCGTSQCMNLV